MRITGSLMACLLPLLASCGGGASPSTPSAPGPVALTLTAPVGESPSDDVQLSVLRPTLTVRNGTSSQAGARTYEFQMSDRSDFSASAASTIPTFFVVISQAGVAEGADGRTSFTPGADLQPATRIYWRARFTQGSSVSAWSDPAMFRTKLVGFSRGGELYDPLIHGESVGTPVGSVTFVEGKGIRLNSQGSYVRYQLAQPLASGEFSAEVEGLHPNGPDHKLKVLSMMDGTGDLAASRYQMSAMYRGVNGNPANCIAFKTVLGTQSRILEPDFGKRLASVFLLDPARTYYWRASWGQEFRLVVSDGLQGTVFYDYAQSTNGASYDPSPHYAYLGSNNSATGLEPGTFPGATFRNVWIGNRPRPASLGSALLAR